MRIQLIYSLKSISSEGALTLYIFTSNSPNDLDQFLQLTQERRMACVEAIRINVDPLLLHVCEHSFLPLGEAGSIIFTYYVKKLEPFSMQRV